MELVSYALLVANTFLLLLVKDSIVRICHFFFLVFYFLTVRFSEPDVDMAVYYHLASGFSPYMMKEFVFYGGINFLYRLIENPSIVFLVVDFMLLLFLFRTLKTALPSRLALYLISLICVSFVGVLGFQNIYRQYTSSILALIAYIYLLDRKVLPSFFVLSVSLFIHNAIILIFPFFFSIYFIRYFKQKLILFLILGLIAVIALYIYFKLGLSYKSNTDTGGNFIYFYWIFSLSLFLCFVSMYIVSKRVVFYSALYLVVLLPVFLVSGGSTAGERFFMMLFPIMLLDFSRSIAHVRVSPTPTASLVLLLLVSPVFLFFSARQFLL